MFQRLSYSVVLVSRNRRYQRFSPIEENAGHRSTYLYLDRLRAIDREEGRNVTRAIVAHEEISPPSEYIGATRYYTHTHLGDN